MRFASTPARCHHFPVLARGTVFRRGKSVTVIGTCSWNLQELGAHAADGTAAVRDHLARTVTPTAGSAEAHRTRTAAPTRPARTAVAREPRFSRPRCVS
ncbi:hypothetical protein [Kitasatospora sp. NPDC051914]|uniref:hypothetical protein n=1 Tax=Kitasatospora sp. NPDC051914 TaxID=3154945 RepID=UPI00343A41A8